MAKKIEKGNNPLDDLIEAEFLESQNIPIESEVKYHLDIGNYALNYCIAKNLKRSIPGGRITSFFGLSGVGKSLLLATIAKDPQLDGIIIIDTEGGGISSSLLKYVNAPIDKIKRLSIATFTDYKIDKINGKVEDVAEKDLPTKLETDKYIYRKGLIHFLKDIIYKLEFTKSDKKILVLLDSLANIKSTRVLAGGEDMGKTSKDVNTLFSTLDVAIEKTNLTFCFTNKVYQNFGNVYDPYVQSMGQAAIYNPSVSVKLTSVSETEDISDAELKEEKLRRKSALGMSMRPVRATVAKSRNGTESRTCTFLLDAALGITRTSGLFELLRDFGIIEKNGSRYSIKNMLNFESFFKKDFANLLVKNEDENIITLQKLLDIREEQIKQERFDLQVSDISEYLEKTGGVADDSENGIDLESMAERMSSDLE